MAHSQIGGAGVCPSFPPWQPFSHARVGGGPTFLRRLHERGVPLLKMGVGRKGRLSQDFRLLP